jgi:hypothetical protein
MAVTTYTLTGSAVGNVNEPYVMTVTLGTGNPGGTIVFTPAVDPNVGTFSPTTLSLTNTTRSGTFTYVPTTAGVKTFTVTDDQNPHLTTTSVLAPLISATDLSYRTVVKNPTARSIMYSFLGPHGVTIAAGGTYSWVGNWDNFGSGTPYKHRAEVADMLRALIKGTLVVVSSPTAFYKDATTGAVKQTKLDNGTLGTIDPTTGAVTIS